MCPRSVVYDINIVPSGPLRAYVTRLIREVEWGIVVIHAGRPTMNTNYARKSFL